MLCSDLMDLDAQRAAVAQIRGDMQLRSGSVVGGSSGVLSTSGQDLFDQGATAIFNRWTALCLAIQEQWGGQDSADKAQQLYLDVIEWFARDRGVLLELLRAHSLCAFPRCLL